MGGPVLELLLTPTMHGPSAEAPWKWSIREESWCFGAAYLPFERDKHYFGARAFESSGNLRKIWMLGRTDFCRCFQFTQKPEKEHRLPADA